MINEAAISEFRRVSKIHEDWLVHTLVGPDLLTKGELEDLQLYSSLPLDSVLDLTTVSYYLGKQAAHLKADAYKSLNFEDLTADFTDLERASITDLRLRSAVEIRRFAQMVSSTTQATVQVCLTKGIQDSVEGGDVASHVWGQLQRVAEESFSKSFTLFQNIYSLAMLDLVHVSKSQAQLNSIVQSEGIYTEGLNSQIMVERGSSFIPVTAHDLMSKSLSGMNLHYVPPGAAYSEGKLQIVDTEKFEESLSKATAVVAPKGASQPTSVAKPGSIKGVAAPDQTPGPGRGGESVTNAPKKGVEYDDWKGAGEPRPPGEGWEQSTTGGWRHIKGGGGVQGPQNDPESLQQKQKEAIQYGKTPHSDTDVLQHLSQGTLVSIKKLSQDESGIHNTFRVTTESGGRGLMKPVTHQTAETHGNFAGTGYGSVPINNSHGHEAAAYQAYTMLGMSTCPPTTIRSFDGATHSIQAWAEDHLPTEVSTLMAGTAEKNQTKALISMVPADKVDEFTDKLMGMITMDIVMNNNDGHRDNVLINKDSTDIKSIDHADSFGTGMKGVRNDFHHDFQKMGKKVTIPETLQTNMRGKSLGDYKRAMGGHVQDWQVGQTYLRTQYALHLQDTEGHLDFNKFLPTMDSFHGGNEFPMKAVRISDTGESEMVVASAWRAKGESYDSYKEFDKRKEEKTLPNDLFQSFAKKFINDHKNNPESSFHEAAKELDDIGVFMPPSAMGDPKAYRKSGEQHQYARTIMARNPPVDVGHKANPGETKTDDLHEIGRAATIQDRRKQREESPKTVKRGRRSED